MQPVRGQLVIDSADAGHVIARYNPLLIAVFTRSPHEAEAREIQRRAAEAVAAGVRGGVLYVVGRRNMSGGMDPRVRAVFEEMIRSHQDRAGSSAVVILTTGFAASIARLAVAGFIRLFRRASILRVFGSLDEACRWLADVHDLDRDDLLAIYGQITATLDDLPR
ncbi:MAG: hypothetical protein JNK45_14755 [Myxococcales bacterium]|nr:hypothetical protein [Myxococcales bacterium]